MSRLLPSEVARLVLGYLKEKGCHRAHDAFLSESPDLGEFRSCLSGPNTYDYPTSVNGKTLHQFLNNSTSHAPVPAPLIAHALPLITTTLPIIAAPVPSPAATVSQREIDMLRKLQANQMTIASLNSKMNEMTGKSRSAGEKRPAKQQSHAAVQRNQKQPVSQSVGRPPSARPIAPAEPRPQQPSDPFKTPVKQIVRRSHQGYATPNRRTAEHPSPKKTTPRKSLTPRKLTLSSDVPASSSSQSSDATLTPSKTNLNNFHVEPEKVIEKFISDPGMPDLLADKINTIWNTFSDARVINLVNGDLSVLTSGVSTPVKSAPSAVQRNDNVCAPMDEVVNSVVKELEQHSTINQFISDFAANECLMDTAFADLDCLFGSESSPFSSYESTPVHSVDDDQDPGSLTTPKSAYREQAIASSSITNTASAVKNLMQDLKTPEKKVPSPFNSSPFVPADKTSGSPVCIVIPDDCGSMLTPALQQLIHQEAAVSSSPAKKLRRIAPDPRHVAPAQHIPLQPQTGDRRKTVPLAELRSAQRCVQSVPGKRVKSAR